MALFSKVTPSWFRSLICTEECQVLTFWKSSDTCWISCCNSCSLLSRATTLLSASVLSFNNSSLKDTGFYPLDIIMFSERTFFRNKNSFKAKVVQYLMNVSTAFESFSSHSKYFVVGMHQGVNYSFKEVKFFTHLWACSWELTLYISSCSSPSSYSLSWVWLRVSLAVFSSSPLSLSSFSR